jgi:putative FmdB family regulatory protein
MPIYEFECPYCGRGFEKILSVANRNEAQECPHCEHPFCLKREIPSSLQIVVPEYFHTTLSDIMPKSDIAKERFFDDKCVHNPDP